MARQGYRVWLTRLTFAAAVLVVLAFGARWLWLRWTQGVVETVVVAPPKSPTPVASDGSAHPHPLDPVLALARVALEKHRKNHSDYTATLVKSERVAGKLLGPIKMELKLRYTTPTSPRSDAPSVSEGNEESQSIPTAMRNVAVYLKFLEPRSQSGREVLWIQGTNDDKLKAHEGGLLGMVTMDLAPNSRLAMMGNRYPITEIGIEKLIMKLIEKGERDRGLGECEVIRKEGEKFDGKECELIEVIHAVKSVEWQGSKIQHEFYKAQIWFDKDELVPLKYSSYSWPTSPGTEPVLEEEYMYFDLKLNEGLQERDFDSNNKKYRF